MATPPQVGIQALADYDPPEGGGDGIEHPEAGGACNGRRSFDVLDDGAL